MSKNDRVPDLRDVHGYFRLARFFGLLLIAAVVAIILVLCY